MLPRGFLMGTTGLLAVASGFARADVDPNSGIDLVRIGSRGNAAWAGNGFSSDMAIGRGSVGYEYSMGRLEVTTAQWTEFFNAVYDRSTPLNIPWVHGPAVWGAVPTTAMNGGVRWTVPAGNENLPVGGISWRTAAIYCNWLNNNKSTSPSAFMNGAYDVSMFGDTGNAYTDQITHNANARYWIPTWDEYIKAAHFDPNRNGSNQPGYWVVNNAVTGHYPVSGAPGTGEANYGFFSPNPFAIPLGSYPTVQSAWGLLDLAGGTSEWTERTLSDFGVGHGRFYEGSAWGSDPNVGLGDTIYDSSGGDSPDLRTYGLGFRIASSVPAPGPCIVGAGVFSILCARRKRRAPLCVAANCSVSRC